MNRPAPSTLETRLRSIRERIDRAAQEVGRDPGDVVLLGVTKRKTAAEVSAGVRAGVDEIAENYVQEALAKIPAVHEQLSPQPGPRWHFVGRLQRNKARQVAEHFDVLQTLDRGKLGDALERHAAAIGRTLDAFLQVDLCGEPQKGGATPEAIPALLEASLHWAHLRVRGLMVLPAAVDDPEASRPVFARLRELRDEMRQQPGGDALRELSMGMSGDFEVAIQEGATIIRLGTALFGPREDTKTGRSE